MSVQQIVQAVEGYLKDVHPGGANLSVLSSGVRQDQQWWYVPVKADVEPQKRFEYYEALAEIESKLQINDKVIVMFIPVVADTVLNN